MITYTINSGNVSNALSQLGKGGKYFIITVDVKLTEDTNIGANSVLSFQGGSFTGNPGVKLHLNSCQICAGPYPIFGQYVEVDGLAGAEVRAEWFRTPKDASDDVHINRALRAARNCPVVLEARVYILKNSIRFTGIPHPTLICPGTLFVSDHAGNIPAIDINTGSVTLKINNIMGTATTKGYKGIGIKSSVYTEHSDIEVNTMTNLNKGIFVQPNVKGTHQDPKDDCGGMQYCRFKLGSILADYCFYIDVFTHAQLVDMDTGKIAVIPSDKEGRKKLKITPLNWFNENQISCELMQGKHGIYVVSPTEAWDFGQDIDPENVDNALNGLKFEDISFERISDLPIRLRSVMRSCFLNMQMFNSLPGTNPLELDYYAPWIDMENVREVRMSFSSFVMPTHIKVGNSCRKSYIQGAVLDAPGHYTSHFDTIGVDTVYRQDTPGKMTKTSQMYVTNSIVPYNMAKNVISGNDVAIMVKYIKDLLPNIKEGTSNPGQISLPVLPTTVNVEVKSGKTIVLDLTGLDVFAPCLHTVNAKIENGGKLQFRACNYLGIEGGTYNPAGYPDGTTVKEITSGGLYHIQWLSNWVIAIKKVANQ